MYCTTNTKNIKNKYAESNYKILAAVIHSHTQQFSFKSRKSKK